MLPAGDVKIGNLDYDIYSNAQFNLKNAAEYPIKMNGENPVLMSDVGELKDAHALQYNVVHVNGNRSVYLPVLKQGGNSNTIAVANGVREMLKLIDRGYIIVKGEVLREGSAEFLANDPTAREIYLGPEFNL